VSVSLQDLPEPARIAWTGLRNELESILGADLVAMWAHGGTVAIEGPPRPADLDTYVIVRHRIDEPTAESIEGVQAIIAQHMGIEWDTWYVVEDDARRPDSPPHAWREERRDTSWAINRAHWLAGRYVLLYGREPAQIVAPPAWSELQVDLDRELEHLEAHVAEGDPDPYEATYAFLNGCRILRALETGDVAISKRAAGPWGLDHLPDRWHPALRAASRAYDGESTPEDVDLLASEMAAFVAMVRDGLAPLTPRAANAKPRWSGT
jgi:hypothetical protein